MTLHVPIPEEWYEKLASLAEIERKEAEAREEQERKRRKATWIPPGSRALREALEAVRRGETPTQVARRLEKERAVLKKQARKAGREAKKQGDWIGDDEHRLRLLQERAGRIREQLEKALTAVEEKKRDLTWEERLRTWLTDIAHQNILREQELYEIERRLRELPKLKRVEEAEAREEKKPGPLDRWLPVLLLAPVGAVLAAVALKQPRGG